MRPEENSPNLQPKLIDPLTERELEILCLLADGCTNQNIAQHLILSIDTVKWYNKRIYGKLFVKNRTQAVKQAREWGLLETKAPQSAPPQKSKPQHNLPAATTPFVGRELELNNIANLLGEENVRLITIMALGGMGKTRLALESAKTQLSAFANGVFFIPLVQLRAVENIIPTIATNLNMQLSAAGEPMAQLQNYLRDKDLLLVLDNFEHLLDGTNVVTSLLEAAPRIKIIVTSRERLNLHGETVYPLGSMALPTDNTAAEMLNCSAVQLFIQRVQMVQVNVSLSNDDLEHVYRICRQVGGMPLGIELAASLVDVLTMVEIASEIESSFDVLETHMRDMPQRLRNIRAVFDYSWSRLTESEQQIYMRLAVFRAGFTRDAAQSVAGATIRVLQRLVNKSLLQRGADNGRYAIHELLRQYIEEKLDASGTADQAYQAHTTYYTTLMAQCDSGIKSHTQLEALNQIEADFENIRATWQRAVAKADFDAIAQSLEALYWFCTMRARVPEGKELLQLAQRQLGISYEPNAHPVQRRLLLAFDNRGENYRAQIEQMLAVVREQKNVNEVAFFLWMLGANRYAANEMDQTLITLKEAVALFQELGDPFYQTESLHKLGISCRFLGQIGAGRMYAEQALKLSRKTGNKFALGRALATQGLMAAFEDNNVEAQSYLQEAIMIRRELGDRAGVAKSILGLSQDAFFKGDFSNARRYAKEGYALAVDSNSPIPKELNQIVLGWVAVIEEDYGKAWDLCLERERIAHDPNIMAFAQFGLAMAACGLEDYPAAEKYLKSLFQSWSPMHTAKGLLSFLAVAAIFYGGEGHTEQAVEMLALALTHPKSPTSWMEKWVLLKRLQTKLETDLGPERYTAAWERGTKLELETVLGKISPG